MALKFEILKKHNKSRLGKLHTKHGIVNTPAFYAGRNLRHSQGHAAGIGGIDRG